MGFFDDIGGGILDFAGTIGGGLAAIPGGLDEEFTGGFFSNNPLAIAGGAAGLAGGISGFATGATIAGGVSVMSSRMQRKALQKQESARQQSRREAEANQNKLIEKNFRQRASSRGQGGSGNLAPGQQNASQQGTSLLVPQASMPSLFEGK